MSLPLDIANALISYQALHKKRPIGIHLSEGSLQILITEAQMLGLTVESRSDLFSGYAYYDVPIVLNNQLPTEMFQLQPNLSDASRPRLVIPG